MAASPVKWKRGDHWFVGEKPVKVPLFGVKLRVEVHDEGEAVTPAQNEALAQFLTLRAADKKGLTHQVALNCQTVDADEVKLKRRADVWEHVQFKSVMVPQHGKSKDRYVFVFAECGWEEEHGLSLLFKNNKLFQVTDQSGLFFNEEWSLYFINE